MEILEYKWVVGLKIEINTLEDFKGLKMRMPGLGAEVINRMGATAVAFLEEKLCLL